MEEQIIKQLIYWCYTVSGVIVFHQKPRLCCIRWFGK